MSPSTLVPAPVFELSGRDGSAPALITAEITLSYAELTARVATRAASWGPSRRLVLVEGGNRLENAICYLAAVNHGHVALVVPENRPSQRAEMVAAYDPDIVCAVEDGIWSDTVRRNHSAHLLHPELAALLSTSGSTGSPQLVRLSRTNLRSNAAAIADYLNLSAEDRGITSLPMHYCYGLSVLHSHLVAGAAVVLTDRSVVDECFWTLFNDAGVTSLAAVPYTIELLDRSGFTTRELPTLRLLTQAGGRLDPARVRELAELGGNRGWELVVMYGQTEATARMAYLPAELTARHPAAVGIAIPGGSLRIEPVDADADRGVGELVYAGPNVMMGYAAGPADLARGAEITELRTGDLARERDGLIEIVGRLNRHAKVFGIRLDLDRIERRLRTAGLPARLLSRGDQVHAFTLDEQHRGRIAATIATLCGIPEYAVRVSVIESTPLTASGKPDHAALARLLAVESEGGPPPEPSGPSGPSEPSVDVRAQFALVLGRPDAGPQDTFVTLGGDSLSYVELATRLEACLPTGLPTGWHTVTIGELTELGSRVHGGHRVASVTRLSRMDTTIPLRALAIVLIVASHADLFDLMGGAHLLLALAGFNFARFQLTVPDPRARLRSGIAGLARLALPSMLWIGGIAVVLGGYDPATVFFLNGLLGSDHWTTQWQFWFLEAFVWITLASLLLLTIPAVARHERRHPFGIAMALLGCAAAVRFLAVGQTAGPTGRYAIGSVAFFFLLGWAAARAERTFQRLLVTTAAVTLVVGYFEDPVREGLILAGLAAMLWCPTVPMPRLLARAVAAVAGASLFVYLTQWQVYPWFEDRGQPVLAVLASILVGLGYGALMRPLQRGLGIALRRDHTAWPNRAPALAVPVRQ